jgi:hypothetical protein
VKENVPVDYPRVPILKEISVEVNVGDPFNTVSYPPLTVATELPIF